MLGGRLDVVKVHGSMAKKGVKSIRRVVLRTKTGCFVFVQRAVISSEVLT